MSEQSPFGPADRAESSNEALSSRIPEELHFAHDFALFLEQDVAYGGLNPEDQILQLPHLAHRFIHRAVEIFPPNVKQSWHKFVPWDRTGEQIDMINHTLARHRNPLHSLSGIQRLKEEERLSYLRQFVYQKLTYNRFPEVYGAHELSRQLLIADQDNVADGANVLLSAYGAVIQGMTPEQRQLPGAYYNSIIFRGTWH